MALENFIRQNMEKQLEQNASNAEDLCVLAKQLILRIKNLKEQKKKKNALLTAVELYERALQINPRCTDAYIGLALLEFEFGKKETSVELLNQAARLGQSKKEELNQMINKVTQEISNEKTLSVKSKYDTGKSPINEIKQKSIVKKDNLSFFAKIIKIFELKPVSSKNKFTLTLNNVNPTAENRFKLNMTATKTSVSFNLKQTNEQNVEEKTENILQSENSKKIAQNRESLLKNSQKMSDKYKTTNPVRKFNNSP